jgi:hypothetical protein
MFKKRSATSKRPKAVRKRTIDDDDDDEDEAAGNPTGTDMSTPNLPTGASAPTTTATTTPMTTQQQIQWTKKKRKLLTDLQYKRGLDTNQLLQQNQTNPNHSSAPDSQTESDSADAAEPDPLSTPATSSAAEKGSQEGVLEIKHKQAMESYIQQKMKMGAANSDSNAEATNMDHDTTEHEIRQHATMLTKEQLYRELAVAAARLAGKTDHDNNNDSSNNNAKSGTTTTTDARDGDVGAGGAMLVAGTGIAEVILPVDERLKTAKDTNESVQARRGPKNKNAAAAAKFRSATTSTATAGSNPNRRQQPQPSAVPNRFFVPNTMASFPVSRDAAAAAAAMSTLLHQQPASATVPNAIDDERLGFDAVKRQREGSGGHHASSSTLPQSQRPNPQHPQQPSSSSSQQRNSRSSDDRVFKKFVSRQRDAQMRDKK